MKNKTLIYKDYPLVRCNNQLYYGNMSDPYIVFMQILQSSNKNNIEVGSKVFIQLLSTDTSLPPSDRIKQQTNKNSLLNSLELSNVWLKKANMSTAN